MPHSSGRTFASRCAILTSVTRENATSRRSSNCRKRNPFSLGPGKRSLLGQRIRWLTATWCVA
eukprot:5217220-Lingulodinium_polyedra.AAC.1